MFPKDYPIRSISQAKRIIKAGGVIINGRKLTDLKYMPKVGDEIQVGKRWFLKVIK